MRLRPDLAKILGWEGGRYLRVVKYVPDSPWVDRLTYVEIKRRNFVEKIYNAVIFPKRVVCCLDPIRRVESEYLVQLFASVRNSHCFIAS